MSSLLSSLLSVIASEYTIHLCILCGIYLILAQSLNLTFGLGQLFNLAHVASYGIGAYATALLSTEADSPFWVCVTASVLLSGLLALLLGAIALRLSNDYFAIGTLAFSAVVSSLLINWRSVTHGVLGIAGIPRPSILDADLDQNVYFLALLALLVVTLQVFFYILFGSHFGRALRGLAECEHAAQALGKDTRLIRNFAFFFSSAGAGLAGSLFAYYLSYIDPSSFSLSEMVFVLTIVVVGKPGSFWGVTGATIFLVLLPEPLRFLEINSAYLGPARQLIHATLLFGVVWWKRRALFPIQRQV